MFLTLKSFVSSPRIFIICTRVFVQLWNISLYYSKYWQETFFFVENWKKNNFRTFIPIEYKIFFIWNRKLFSYFFIYSTITWMKAFFTQFLLFQKLTKRQFKTSCSGNTTVSQPFKVLNDILGHGSKNVSQPHHHCLGLANLRIWGSKVDIFVFEFMMIFRTLTNTCSFKLMEGSKISDFTLFWTTNFSFL